MDTGLCHIHEMETEISAVTCILYEEGESAEWK